MNLLDLVVPRVPLLSPPPPVAEEIMITGDIFKTIQQLHGRGVGIKAIARLLDLDPDTVRKYKDQPEFLPYDREKPVQQSLDGIEEWLRNRAPEVGFNGKVLYREAQAKGYLGSYSVIKRFLAPIREKEHIASVATVRFETPAGAQGQVDWGSSKVWIGPEAVRVHFFVLVLGYSRRMFAHAYRDEKRHHVIDGHQKAFAWFGGYPKELLYDNARTMIMTEKPKDERLNKVFEDFARHYGFEVRFCRPYRARTKGKVESGVKYLKRNFLKGCRFQSLEDLNLRLSQWLTEVADQRIHGTTHVTPISRWEAEKEGLIKLSTVRPWQPDQDHTRRVANDARVTVATNLYPVDPGVIGKQVSVSVREGKVEIRNEKKELVACHDQLAGRFSEAPAPTDFIMRITQTQQREAAAIPPQNDPRWAGEDVQVRDLSVYDEVAGIKEVA